MNENQQNEKATSGQSKFSTLKSSCSPKEIKSSNQIPKLQKLNSEINEIDRKNFYHWGATRKSLEFIRRRNNSPDTQANRAEKRVIPARNNDTPE